LKFKNNKSKNVVYNERIRSPKVRCINKNNENLGIMTIKEAIDLAKFEGLDLIQISYDKEAPICRIMDYGKFKYDKSKKEKLLNKKRRESVIKVKEVKFRPTTDSNDLNVKAKMATRFLSEGNRVKVVLKFSGREVSLKKVAFDKIYLFFDLLQNFIVLNEPSFDGKKSITSVIGPVST